MYFIKLIKSKYWKVALHWVLGRMSRHRVGEDCFCFCFCFCKVSRGQTGLLLTRSVVISGRPYQFPGEVIMLTIILFLYFSPWIIPTSATDLQFRLGSCFQSGMVVQSSGRLWGWGQPGAEVEVELSNGTVLGRGRVAGDGWWSVGLVLAPGGPYNLTLHHR